MTYLALNKAQLSRFSHHWLWGLRIDKPGRQTLYDAALYLETHPEEQEAIAAQLEQISRSWWLVRAVYWLFNINQYRLNYYALHSYVCLQHYQQGVSMLSPEERRSAEALGGFVLLLVAFRFSKPILSTVMNAITPGMDWFSDQLKSFLPENFPSIHETDRSLAQSTGEVTSLLPMISLTSLNQPDEEAPLSYRRSEELTRYFTVKRVMIAPLETLGLIHNVGDQISFPTLKAAYRDSLNRTHPDKTGVNISAPFIQVREAFHLILDAVNTTPHPDATLDNFLSEFKKSADLLDQRLDQEFLVLRTLRTRIDKYSEKADMHIQRVDKYCNDVGDLRVESKKLNEGVSSLLREVRAMNAAEQAEEEAVDAIIALAEMYDAVEAYPPYALHGKNRHRFIGHDLTAISESKSDNNSAQSALLSTP